MNKNELSGNLCLISMALIVAFVFSKIVVFEITKVLMRDFGIKTTFAADEISVYEDKDGIWLCVYLKNSNIVYEGSLCKKEMESDKTKFISLSGYRKYTTDSNEKPVVPYIYNYAGNDNEKVILYFDEILRMEIRDTSV